MTTIHPSVGWFIESFTFRPGAVYRWHVEGHNEFAAEMNRIDAARPVNERCGGASESFSWSVPNLSGFAFRLRPVSAEADVALPGIEPTELVMRPLCELPEPAFELRPPVNRRAEQKGLF